MVHRFVQEVFKTEKKKKQLIENPKTQNKNESNLNLSNKNTQSKVTCQTERRREKLNLNTKIETNPNKISNPNHN